MLMFNSLYAQGIVQTCPEGSVKMTTNLWMVDPADWSNDPVGTTGFLAQWYDVRVYIDYVSEGIALKEGPKQTFCLKSESYDCWPNEGECAENTIVKLL